MIMATGGSSVVDRNQKKRLSALFSLPNTMTYDVGTPTRMQMATAAHGDDGGVLQVAKDLLLEDDPVVLQGRVGEPQRGRDRVRLCLEARQEHVQERKCPDHGDTPGHRDPQQAAAPARAGDHDEASAKRRRNQRNRTKMATRVMATVTTARAAA